LILGKISATLKKRGYSRRGNILSKTIDRNVAVVEFQRNPDRASSSYDFFINRKFE
jgi:hypothetical protein